MVAVAAVCRLPAGRPASAVTVAAAMVSALLLWLKHRPAVGQALRFGIALVLLAALGWAIYHRGYQQAEREGQLAMAELKREQAEALVRATANARAAERRAVQLAHEAEARQLAEQRQHAAESATLKQRITHVTTLYKRALDAAPEPLPVCLFTRGWLRDYNAAFGLPGAELSAGATSPAAAPDAARAADAELLASGITAADILAHASDYGRYCRDLASQTNALIDVIEQRSTTP